MNNMMQTKRSSILAITIILLLTFFLSYYNHQVTDEATNTDGGFSSSKAISRLEQLLPANNQPHPVNSIANIGVRNKIIEQLDAMDLKSDIQKTMSCNNSVRSLVCSNISNIITQISGTDPSNTVLLTAHYDSVPAGPGAADAGHAVAIILELLELIQNQAPFKNNLIVLFNEGEEAGLLGAEAFMAEHPLAKDVDVIINLEARGNQGKSMLFETGENNYSLIKLYQQFAKEPLSNSLTYEIYKLLSNDTDLTVFKRHGLTGVNFAFQGRVSHYHTPLDNLQNLSPGSVQHQGDNTFAILQSLLNVDWHLLPEGNAVYTDILSSFMVVWPETMTIPLTLIALLLMLFISRNLVTKKKIKFNQLLIALPFAFTIIILSVLSCWLVLFTVQFISGQQQPWLSLPMPMRSAIWLFPFSIALLFTNIFKEKLKFWGLFLSAATTLLLIAIAASIYMPGISYLSLIPLLALTVLISIALITGQNNNYRVITGILLLSIMFMALLVFPILLMLEDAMGFSVAPLFGLLESFVILLALPIMMFVEKKSLKVVILSTIVISLIGIMISTQLNSFSQQHPQMLNFEYHQKDKEANIQAVTFSPLPQSIVEKSAFSNEQKTPHPIYPMEFSSIKTETIGLPEAKLEIIALKRVEDTTQATLRFTSKRNSSRFLIVSDDPKRLQQLSFDNKNKRSFPFPTSVAKQSFMCTGIDCNGITFTITFTGNEPLELDLIDYRFGLPEPLQYLKQIRGVTEQQGQNGDLTIVQSVIVIPTATNTRDF